ncbi:hypothetical protein E2C01_051538 [Portunus trituberculatus]|uniref:Uncharacterized protein n=1 Tax=Portunus trituberculatus TaxID=210409 RepID=A0A5B7GJG9_PORTR|nr:hypothetical protein [Portunus trituberculatus]
MLPSLTSRVHISNTLNIFPHRNHIIPPLPYSTPSLQPPPPGNSSLTPTQYTQLKQLGYATKHSKRKSVFKHLQTSIFRKSVCDKALHITLN